MRGFCVGLAGLREFVPPKRCIGQMHAGFRITFHIRELLQEAFDRPLCKSRPYPGGFCHMQLL